jgi:hypothetical protein
MTSSDVSQTRVRTRTYLLFEILSRHLHNAHAMAHIEERWQMSRYAIMCPAQERPLGGFCVGHSVVRLWVFHLLLGWDR